MIDRSETVLPGSSPDTEAESTVETVAEEPVITASWPAESTVRSSRLDRAIWGAGEVLQRHWMLALLIAGGLLLRVVTQFAYEPALLFIDSKKYLYGTDFNLGAWGSFDPIGYTLLVLKPVLIFTNLGFVAVLQHVLGLGMAVALYVLMLRRGVVRWLAALAVAPVLLDAYQLNAEQTIMPDVLFEALVVAGIVLLLWRPRPALAFVILAGLALGTSAPVRQVGEALILPALIYVVAAARDWRTRLLHGAVLTVCFALPIVGYMGYSKVVLHYGFQMSSMGDAYLYGRAAHAADCATLTLPPDERVLCPTQAQALKFGVDGLVNNPDSPRVEYAVDVRQGVPDYNLPQQKQFAYAVIKQEPMRVIGDITRDSIKIFALTRNTVEGDTPIKRWQFQNVYPTFPPGITAKGSHSATNLFAAAGGGGQARVRRPLAVGLRFYQLHGGYTPGPVLLLGLLLGLAGIFTFGRRRDPANLSLACLLVTGSAVAVLLGADLYEFSWRYQLPALVTLPIAGAFGATAIAQQLRNRRERKAAPVAPVEELVVAESEQVS
ncbi:MAG TPA: hypothetical protein VJ351_17145 [Streptosporangiaceae bacterium]|nr:hypothetical protein [Streptosporangiaceae bacterium]